MIVLVFNNRYAQEKFGKTRTYEVESQISMQEMIQADFVIDMHDGKILKSRWHKTERLVNFALTRLS